jgi:hypothetical protein
VRKGLFELRSQRVGTYSEKKNDPGKRNWNWKMKFLYCVVPFLGGLALASDLVAEKCLCPEVKCPGNDAAVSHMFKLF